MASFAIIGFGCAGYHAVTAIRQADAVSAIDIYSEHPDPPNNPMLTTYYASNRLCYEGMFPFGNLEELASAYNANIYSNTTVAGIDGAAREIILENGYRKKYDKILIATGAHTFIPPIPNACPEITISMRTLEDARDFRNRLNQDHIRQAVVIGASMAGIKVVEALHNHGIRTILADMAPHIFPLAAYPATAARIEEALAAKGISLKFHAGLKAIHKGSSMADVEFSDGSVVSADLVALCLGTRANTSLAADAGIRVNRGILVNANMETSVPGIYAAGDCCEGGNIQSGESQIIGLWANAAYQGFTAGSNMAGKYQAFQGNILHNITHFFDMDFIGFGDNRIKGTALSFENRKKGLWMEAVKTETGIAGINILGNYRISGILKNHILTLLKDPRHKISDMQRGILRKEGLNDAFISLLEGNKSGD